MRRKQIFHRNIKRQTLFEVSVVLGLIVVAVFLQNVIYVAPTHASLPGFDVSISWSSSGPGKLDITATATNVDTSMGIVFRMDCNTNQGGWDQIQGVPNPSGTESYTYNCDSVVSAGGKWDIAVQASQSTPCPCIVNDSAKDVFVVEPPPPPPPVCGNNKCESGESCGSCPTDCEVCKLFDKKHNNGCSKDNECSSSLCCLSDGWKIKSGKTINTKKQCHLPLAHNSTECRGNHNAKCTINSDCTNNRNPENIIFCCTYGADAGKNFECHDGSPLIVHGGVCAGDPPIALFSVASNALPKTLDFTDLTAGMEVGDRWDWSFDDGTFDTIFVPGVTISHTYSSFGSYTVTLTARNPWLPTNTHVVMVDVFPPPVSISITDPPDGDWMYEDFDITYDIANGGAAPVCELSVSTDGGGFYDAKSPFPFTCANGIGHTGTISAGRLASDWCNVQGTDTCKVRLTVTESVLNFDQDEISAHVDYTAPTITSFIVNTKSWPAVVTTTTGVIVTGAATDSGGSGIARYELWRTNDLAGVPDATNWASVDFNISSFSLSDTPPNGMWWYGVHIVDGVSNCITETGGHCGGVTADALGRPIVGPIAVIKPPPSASFTIDPVDALEGSVVAFDDTSVNVDVWRWDFDGDGTIDCDSILDAACVSGDTTFSYTLPGTIAVTYTAKLIATNTLLGEDYTAVGTVTIFPPTSANFDITLDPISGVEPVEATFTDTSIGADMWTWDFDTSIDSDGDGDPTNDPDHIGKTPPPQLYATAGTYTVGLTVENSILSTTASITKTFIVLPDKPPTIVSLSAIPSNPGDKETIDFEASATDDRVQAGEPLVLDIKVFANSSFVDSNTCTGFSSLVSCEVTGLGPFSAKTVIKYTVIATDYIGQSTSKTESLVVGAVGGLIPCGRETDDPTTTSIVESEPCGFCHTFALVSNILNLLVWPLGPSIAALMLAAGGFMFLAGGANPIWITRARSIMTAAVIGIVIIFVAWLAVHFVLDFFGVATWTGLGTWWQITC